MSALDEPLIIPLLPNRPRLRFLEGAPDGVAPDEGDGADSDADGADGEPDASDDADDETPGEEALGDPGKRALEATKAKWRTERDKRLALEQQLRDATKPKDDAPDPDQIRADATREATEKANLRIVRAEIKGAAASLFEDPADALAFLDLKQFDVDDDGDVDETEITEALKDLLVKKPHLAKQNSAPQGGSKKRIPEVPADPANKTSIPVSHADKVKAAKAAGDWAAVIALENDLLEQK